MFANNFTTNSCYTHQIETQRKRRGRLGCQDRFLRTEFISVLFCRAPLRKSEGTKLSVRVAIVDVDSVVGDLDGVGLLVDAVEGVVAK